jgi:hypothetical protein
LYLASSALDLEHATDCPILSSNVPKWKFNLRILSVVFYSVCPPSFKMHSPMHQLEEPWWLLHVGADDPEDLLPSRSRQDLQLKA